MACGFSWIEDPISEWSTDNMQECQTSEMDWTWTANHALLDLQLEGAKAGKRNKQKP